MKFPLLSDEDFQEFLTTNTTTSDTAHDIQHVKRVVKNALLIAEKEHADIEIVRAAAWLHDCVHVPKSSPLRSKASLLSAEQAVDFLRRRSVPENICQNVFHAIHAHSFSAEISPETLEAKVIQDADRLDAIGAIGIARCLMLGGELQRELYSVEDPFCKQRIPNDTVFTIDHFYQKLLRLESLLQTPTGRAMAQSRTEFMSNFLHQLENEIGMDKSSFWASNVS